MMLVHKIEKLCGGEAFWDYNLTWNTSNPDFTDCFQRTFLAWIPCALLWLLSPLEVYALYQSTCSKRGYIPWTILNATKIFVCAVLVCISLIELGVSIITCSSNVYVPPVGFLTPGIELCTFILVLSFTILEKKKGIQTSGVQWFFWLASVIAGLPVYRSFLLRALNEHMKIDELEFVTEAVTYPLIVVQFVLCCVADASPISEHLDEDESKAPPCPELSAAFPSLLFFSWFDSMAFQGFRTDLEKKDLWALNPHDNSEVIFSIFNKYWQKDEESRTPKSSVIKDKYYEERPQFLQETVVINAKVTSKEPSIVKVLFQSFGWLYVFGTTLKFISDLFLFVNPLILDLLITFVSSNDPQWKGFLYAVIMITVAVINLVMMGRSSHIAYLVGMRIRSALISAIYRKALRLSTSAKRDYTLGEIVNLMAVDVQRMVDVTVFFNLAWTTPVQFSIALYLLWQRLGPAVLSGIGVILLLSITTIGTAGYAKKLQTNQMKLKDRRIKLMNEILNGIKVLKLYAWETCFSDIVSGIRSQEILVLRKAAYFGTGMNFVWMTSSVLISLMTFATYVLIDSKNVLDANKAFVSLSLFGVMQTPIMLMPMTIVSMIQATVALKRIKKFMMCEEIDLDNVQHVYDPKHPIKVEKASFSWSSQDLPILHDINLKVKKNSLVAIVGPVGAGKSSLISAILGEMEKIQGKVAVSDSIAYVSQLAWMQNATIRDNILFGRQYKAAFYNKVIDSCALNPDLQILPAGDQTEIGEKGINLSGGQKQRISLARAVYSEANIYLFDDPLSAVDVHVGSHIFDNVIGPKGMLQEKTRVLVTHRITYLPQVDNIVVVNNGSISEVGTYKELLDRKGVFAEFLVTYLSSPDNDEEEPEGMDVIKEELLTKIGSAERDTSFSRSMSRSEPSDGTIVSKHDMATSTSITLTSSQLSRSQSTKDEQADHPDGTLIVSESAEMGKVKMDTYLHYARSISFRVICFTFMFYIVAYACSMGSSIWLSMWSNDKPNEDGIQDPAHRDLRLGVYGGLGITFALLTFCSGLMITYGTTKAAEKLHSKMLYNIVRSPMSFFDTTPIGRIVNRFSKDVDVLDLTIPQILQMWMGTLFQILATIVVISIGTPVFLAAALPNFVLYYFLQRFYVATSRQLKRLESITRSPIYSHFSESVAGAATIRAFGRQDDFISQSEIKVDQNQMCYYPSIISNRWISIRLELIGNVLVLCAALLAVIGRDTLNSGLVGLTVSYALSITVMLNWVVRLTSDLETNIVAVERIKEYTLTPTEAEILIPENKPAIGWPTLGKITFDRYCTRYREGLDLVLRKVTCNIESGEKVGIVGRTGAGKSSLTQALFRIVEAAGGSIKIDGVEISKLGLHDLRSRLTIIPQDPALFSGTLRVNLDPFNAHADEEIWKVLELSHLKIFIASLPDGLEHNIAEGGENLSVGQRQLICLARALLRKTKILVLDEATAAVDLETDDLIQATIRKEFKDCTVLTIAHRINTIMDNDRIMVLDQGAIKEFESPKTLLQTKSSIFYGMAKDAGLA